MATYVPLGRAASVFRRHVRTIENWVGAGFIHGYRDRSGAILVDLAEIEAAFRTNPRMRDGRKPYGPLSKILPLPGNVANSSPTEVER